uniref:Uncharacterized protein n=1 Tax=Anguilla anguilla TaxID=7936 RepID=A0A0E9SBA9_ANGAN
MYSIRVKYALSVILSILHVNSKYRPMEMCTTSSLRIQQSVYAYSCGVLVQMMDVHVKLRSG